MRGRLLREGRRAISIEADQRVEKPVKSLAPSDGRVRINLFQRFRVGIKQRPGGPRIELGVRWLSPLTQNLRDLSGGNGRAIYRPYDQIMRQPIRHRSFLIGINPPIQVTKPITELAHGASREMTQITMSILGMFATDFNFTIEAKIVANEYSCARYKTCRVRHIVTIAEANDPLMAGGEMSRQLHGENRKVSGTFVTEGMSLTFDGKSAGLQLGFDFVEDGTVGEGKPRFRAGWSRYVVESVSGNGFSSAVQKQAAGLLINNIHNIWVC
jgi:hypothetical protein